MPREQKPTPSRQLLDYNSAVPLGFTPHDSLNSFAQALSLTGRMLGIRRLFAQPVQLVVYRETMQARYGPDGMPPQGMVGEGTQLHHFALAAGGNVGHVYKLRPVASGTEVHSFRTEMYIEAVRIAEQVRQESGRRVSLLVDNFPHWSEILSPSATRRVFRQARGLPGWQESDGPKYVVTSNDAPSVEDTDEA